MTGSDVGAEVDDAERGQQIAPIPLLAGVVGRARPRTGWERENVQGARLAKGPILDALLGSARLVRYEARAALIAERKGPAARPMPRGDDFHQATEFARSMTDCEPSMRCLMNLPKRLSAR